MLISSSAISVQVNDNASLQRFDCGGISMLLFPGNEVEGGPTNLYLRRYVGSSVEWTPLLGPRSPTRLHAPLEPNRLVASGSWGGIDYSLALVLAREAAAWFWHVRLENGTSKAQQLDLTYAQDLALAPYGALRMNEFYVSQYIDHTPMSHADRGYVVASRQNQAADGRHPWSLIGSLRSGASFATDSLQFHGLGARIDAAPQGLVADLPGRRLQHEHSMVVVRDAPMALQAGESADAGFFGSFVADHSAATSDADLERVNEVLALPEAIPQPAATASQGARANETFADVSSLFSSAPLLAALDLDAGDLQAQFGTAWRHEEVNERGERLSFFHGDSRHVTLRAKELAVLRPHGHLLRTGLHTTPDESALTSTAWMGGVFHSMIAQGHVSINRFLSTARSYLGLFRSHGQRVFAEIDGTWHLLGVPSAFEISPNACRWIYKHRGGVIQVRAEAATEPHELGLFIDVLAGPSIRFLFAHHVALNGDDGSARGEARWEREGDEIVATAIPDSDVGCRFPTGSFRIALARGTTVQSVGGDELLFNDGRSRQQPFICLLTAPASSAGLRIRGRLVAEETQTPLRVRSASDLYPRMTFGGVSDDELARVGDIVPWFTHNAWVHYLSPRGLEQYSGGGWGTRDVCQGPVELLLALRRFDSIRDLLFRVLAMQNPDGDWPQWFMFFDRERNIRPGDSHGDIVFWPLVVLSQYLVATGDTAVLDERVPFFHSSGPQAAEQATVWQHAERALEVIEKRVIPGTTLAAYGHGDWNDSLQPADPSMREHLCSAWTVTLHFQTLTGLAQAMRALGRAGEATRLTSWADRVRQDFQRLLLVDGVLAGYAHFADGVPRHLLHPRDQTTGVQYSSLAMIHAILEDLLTPEQAREHLGLIEAHLSAADGVRLFDRPMTYCGGPQRLFQRAESATFFGREIGLMYMHAHLRFAQALAHIGEADRFFHALCQAIPIGIRSIVPTAALRQANCYYSSSDAAFADRYEASAAYERVARGEIALDGGWRVYSSGAGIAVGLVVRRLLGLDVEAAAISVDPVIPVRLDGLQVDTTLLDCPVRVRYRIGPSGCGVNAIALNGQPIPFTLRSNPHRRGAAIVARADLIPHLAKERNVLAIDVGHRNPT